MNHGDVFEKQSFEFDGSSWHWVTKKVRYRLDPVPGIRRWGNWCFYRRPKTTQLKRWNNAWEDIGVKGRAKLNNQPDAWCDIPKDHVNKSWKHYRKTQHK